MKSPTDNIIYIPPRIAQAVGVLTQEPMTLITAGSGFGKTTAVSACLESVPRETLYHWYTCFGESPEKAWEGICRLISFADARVGDHLAKLELPTLNCLGYISALMGELSCDREIILIIDNFQFAQFPAPYRLLGALAMHRCKRLHLVVLSHPLYLEEKPLGSIPRVHCISQELFCFTAPDIRRLFSLNGASISEEQAERLAEETEGWVAALRLHLTAFLHDGRLAWSMGINELMELSFWQRLDQQQQQLFLGLSLLDTFTEAQAARMLGRDVMPDALWASVAGNAFVRKSSREYTLHNLLKSFLSVKFQTQPDSFCRKMLARAGAACQLQGKNVQAMLFFIRAGEDLSALTVPVASVELAELVRTREEPFNTLLSRCRTEALEGRWLLLLGTAVKASLNSKRQLARTALARLGQLRELTGSSTEQKQAVAAALEMAASFQAYNDIGEMSRCHAAAIALLDDPQDFYVTNDSWTFCIPSVVYMFWRERGGLAQSKALLKAGIPKYALLSSGKGMGASEMMEAEAALLAGKLEEGVTGAYLACAIAQRAGQDSLLFCAHMLLARAALLQGDAAAFESALAAIRALAFGGKEFLCVPASEAALGFLYSLLGMEEKLPAWMLSAESARETLYPVSVPFALIVTLRYIRAHTPEALIGTAEAYIREAQEQHHLLPQLYFRLEQAVWYEQHGRHEDALKETGLALADALPDQVLLPFAEYHAALSAVIGEAALSCGGEELAQRLCALGRRFESGAATIRAAQGGVFPLTPREREIALLAQQRVATKKIAETLHIAPATVKNTLNKVYSKLGVSGKAELEGRQL